MREVEVLVAEALAQLVDPLQSPDQEALEGKLEGDPEPDLLAEVVRAGRERLGRAPARQGNEDRGLDLEEAGLVQEAAGLPDEDRAGPEAGPGLGRRQQIQVATTETFLDVLEAVELLRRWRDRLGEQLDPSGHEGGLSSSRERRPSLRTDQVAGVEVPEPGVVGSFAENVGAQDQLEGPREVVDVREGGTAMDPKGMEAAGDPHRVSFGFLAGGEREALVPYELGRHPAREPPGVGFASLLPPPGDLRPTLVLEGGLVHVPARSERRGLGDGSCEARSRR